MKYSPLFWPIRLQGNKIIVLDETLLPHKLNFITVRDYKDSCRVIKQMKTRAIGQVLLVFYTFLLILKQNNAKKNTLPLLKKIANALNSTRPTLSFKYITDMVLSWAQADGKLEKKILSFLEMLKNMRIRQAKDLSKLIKNNDAILTHCNISGLLSLAADFSRKEKKKIRFYVTETRPYLQGSRLTAWELKNSGFDVTVIADNMVAQVMKEGKISKVVVGADHLARNGDIANKIGTYQIALLAKHFKIPFYAVCPPASNAKAGSDIKIEIRPEDELLVFNGKKIAPEGVNGYYPAFDITPDKLITRHIYMGI
ncbi:MAG: hypothetical protein C4533_00550 [Candidatus Omnitrophota bacterium]|jgi:methylthioribose-1-phosphate isomerase|nr:MAG: hypothetical protein C4533_00550 [Candidatus Omnitrophota bacterium]